MAKARFEVLRPYCEGVRQFLNRLQFSESDVTWTETGGFIYREFILRGPVPVVKGALASLRTYLN